MVMARFMRLSSGYTGAVLPPSDSTIALDVMADLVAANSCSGETKSATAWFAAFARRA